MTALPGGVQSVVDAAEQMGLSIDVIEYPDGTRTAVDAALAVGCEVGQIVKSMIFAIDGDLVLALTSGSNRVDPTALLEAAGGTECGRADVDDVRSATGFAIGGVPPFGHATPIRAFLDPALLEFDMVWAAAGTPRHVFSVDPHALLERTGATVAPFATPS